MALGTSKSAVALEAVLFLGGMVGLALVIGGGFYLVIVYGGWLLTSIYTLLRGALPHAAALALAVMLAALIVYVTVPRCIAWGLTARARG